MNELTTAGGMTVETAELMCFETDSPFASFDPERKWCVLHTKSRREKKLVGQCAALSIPSYLPLRKSVTMCTGRRHEADVPLFPGYAFAYMDRQDRTEVYRTGHAANIIDVFDQEGLLADLRRIKNAQEQGACLIPERVIVRGTRVRIIDGPLMGLEGAVRTLKGRTRLLLSVDCIQQAVSCEVDKSMVVPL